MFFIGVPLLAIFMPVVFFGLSVEDGFECLTSNWVGGLIFTSTYWIGDRYILIFFRKKYPSVSSITKRVLFTALAIIIYTIVVMVLVTAFMNFIGFDPSEMKANTSFARALTASLITTAIVLLLYESVYFINLWKSSLVLSEKLRKDQIESQLQFLKTQVNPHFLFNSLNTLSSLIPHDSEQAVNFVQHLSSVYRRLLDNDQRQTITLREELQNAGDFIYLIKTRFQEGVQIEISPEAKSNSFYIVSMSVQMAIENAVKHNIASVRRPLKIVIEIQNDWLVIKNNLQPRQEITSGSLTGLKNISSRYQLLFEREIRIDDDGEFFILYLPLIEIQE
jgi:sensor histidine kinase YesM